MRTLQFTLICLYYYGRELLRNPGYIIAFLSLFFVTHKLGTWAAWFLNGF